MSAQEKPSAWILKRGRITDTSGLRKLRLTIILFVSPSSWAQKGPFRRTEPSNFIPLPDIVVVVGK